MWQGHSHYLVTGLQAGHVNRQVRTRAAMRLDVGVLGTEELLGTLDADRLGRVDVGVAAVVSFAWIALSVLVCQDRTERHKHRTRNVVFRRD